MRVQLISTTVVFILCVSLASSLDWDAPIQFCAKKAFAVADHPKCLWMSDDCYKRNEKYAANISKHMCSNTFTVRKLGEFCCSSSLSDMNEIVDHASVYSRRRRSKAHQKVSSSSSNEFDQLISSSIP